MKLELKHLAPYLPYGLKLVYLDGSIRDLIYLDLQSLSRIGIYCKPILRPLSDLTKEIEVNGEKFVPIIELQNFETTHFLIHCDSKKIIEQQKIIEVKTFEYSEGNTHIVKYVEPYGNMENGIITFEYSEQFDRFGKAMLSPYRKPLGVGGQLQMFQKLFEWNFDVFNLIPQGLAIDTNLVECIKEHKP